MGRVRASLWESEEADRAQRVRSNRGVEKVVSRDSWLVVSGCFDPSCWASRWWDY